MCVSRCYDQNAALVLCFWQGSEFVKDKSVSVLLLAGGKGKRMGVSVFLYDFNPCSWGLYAIDMLTLVAYEHTVLAFTEEFPLARESLSFPLYIVFWLLKFSFLYRAL